MDVSREMLEVGTFCGRRSLTRLNFDIAHILAG